MTISINSKRYRVLQDRGFSKLRNLYLKVVQDNDAPLRLRLAIKPVGSSQWEFAQDDPFNQEQS